MNRPQYGTVVFGWLSIVAAAFAALWSLDNSDDWQRAVDDSAGWLIAVVIVQIPALLALRAPARDAPYSAGRACAFGLPAALAAGFAVFWGCVPIGVAMSKLPQLRGLIFAFVVGLLLAIGAGAYFYRALRRDDHPRGARHVLVLVTASGVLGVLAMTILIQRADTWLSMSLVVGAPVLWTLPLWLLISLPPPPPIPRASIAR